MSAAGLHGSIVAQRRWPGQSAELGVKGIHAVRICGQTVIAHQFAVSLCSVVVPASAVTRRFDASGTSVAEREPVTSLP